MYSFNIIIIAIPGIPHVQNLYFYKRWRYVFVQRVRLEKSWFLMQKSMSACVISLNSNDIYSYVATSTFIVIKGMLLKENLVVYYLKMPRFHYCAECDIASSCPCSKGTRSWSSLSHHHNRRFALELIYQFVWQCYWHRPQFIFNIARLMKRGNLAGNLIFNTFILTFKVPVHCSWLKVLNEILKAHIVGYSLWFFIYFYRTHAIFQHIKQDLSIPDSIFDDNK